MIFKRSLINELVNTAGAVFTVIFSIVLAIGLVRILGMAAGGRIDSAAVLEMVVYKTLVNLGPILSASLFVSILLTLMRAWVDSEMFVWFTTGGISLSRWISPVLTFSFPIIVLIAILSTVLSPWADAQSEKNKDSFAQRDDISRLTPGRFIEGEKGRQMFFVEELVPETQNVRNVFIFETHGKAEKIIVAETGNLKANDKGDRYVTLQNGRQFEMKPSSKDYAVTDFGTFSKRLDIKPDAILSKSVDFSIMRIDELWKSSRAGAKGELFWRLSWPWTAVNLVLLAIPLSFTNPRNGKKINLIISLLVFILYLNVLGLGKDAVAHGQIAWFLAFLLVNGIFSVLAALLLLRRTVLQMGLRSLRGSYG